MSSQSQIKRSVALGRTGLDRQMEGSVQPYSKEMSSMTREELLELRNRNNKLLSNETLVNTLPDKGAKLKNSITQIDKLLSKFKTNDESAAENVKSDTTDDEAKQSDRDASPDARKESIERANALAKEYKGTSSLLAARKPVQGQSEAKASKTQMLSLDEAVKLQDHQQQFIKEAKLRRQMENLEKPKPSPADDLSLSLGALKLSDDTSSNQDSGDEDSIDEAQYDSYYDDDEGFDEEYVEDHR